MKPTILYVDDEDMNRFLFEKIFESSYIVITASSGKEGLKKLQDNSDITAVLCDMLMPEMDGLEFVTLAKKEFSELSYYVLSALAYSMEIEKALETGLIKDFFSKPFNFSDIHDTLSKA